ncbi:alpha/beta fold hydrolase [Streptosporangium lutulentum]
MTTIHTLDISGGRLHYEVRGAGPLLLVMGAPMSAAAFAPLADALAGDHTVVTHDPRGVAGSTLDDPEQDSTPSCGRTTSPPFWTPWEPSPPTCSAAAAAR